MLCWECAVLDYARMPLHYIEVSTDLTLTILFNNDVNVIGMDWHLLHIHQP